MTDELRDLLDSRAAGADLAPVPTSVIVAAGRRAARRRTTVRGAGLAGGLAVLAVAGVLVLPHLGGSHAVDPASGAQTAVTSADVTWATGSTLHTPQVAVDLGHPVLVYVTTAAGVVFADPDGTVYSYADGATTEVGHLDAASARLVADTDGTRAGWIDPRDGRPLFTVLDQSDGAVVTAGGHIADPTALGDVLTQPTAFFAVDGATAYWRDDRGTVAVDLAAADPDATAEVVLPPASKDTVLAAQNGLITFDPAQGGTVLGRTRASAKPLGDQTDTQSASFSPGGAFLTVDADDLEVYDASTRERLPLTAKGYDFAAGYAWLDDTTVVAIASRTTTARPVLLTCSVTTADCAVAAGDIGSFDDFGNGDAVLPSGELPE